MVWISLKFLYLSSFVQVTSILAAILVAASSDPTSSVRLEILQALPERVDPYLIGVCLSRNSLPH